MKVAYITATHIPASGAQSLQIAAMAKAFGEVLGSRFVCISPRGKEGGDTSASFAWYRVRTLVSWRPLRSLILLLRSIPLVYRFRPDVIYTRDIGIALGAALCGIHAVYEIHKSFSTWIGKKLCLWLSGRCMMVSISAALKDFVVTEYGYDEGTVFVAHDGIATEWLTHTITSLKRSEIRHTYFGVHDDRPVLLYAGTVGVGRGVGMMLRAAATLPTYQFVFIGATQHDIESSGHVPHNVHIVPRQPQSVIADCLRAADVLLIPYTSDLPTYRFMSPLKLFEYMASGVPIVASRLGSMVEVAHDENAFLFTPGDQDEFEDMLRRAVNDKSAILRKTACARTEVEQMTWTNRVRSILTFLSSKVKIDI